MSYEVALLSLSLSRNKAFLGPLLFAPLARMGDVRQKEHPTNIPAHCSSGEVTRQTAFLSSLRSLLRLVLDILSKIFS